MIDDDKLNDEEPIKLTDDEKIQEVIISAMWRADRELVLIGQELARLELREFNFGNVHGFLKDKFEKALPNLMNRILGEFVNTINSDTTEMLEEQKCFLKTVGAVRKDIKAIDEAKR